MYTASDNNCCLDKVCVLKTTGVYLLFKVDTNTCNRDEVFRNWSDPSEGKDDFLFIYWKENYINFLTVGTKKD